MQTESATAAPETQQFEIKHHTGAVLYTGGGESLREVVEAAVREGVDLSGALLNGALLNGAWLDGARLDGARLNGARLVGARLNGAWLVGARLDGAWLDGARLDGARLNGARLDGARLDGAWLDGARLVGQRPILQIGPIGSRSDYLVAYLTDAGIKISAGCFSGALDEFRAACIKTHGENEHGREYAAAIVMIEAHAELWTPAAEQPQEAAA